MEERKSMGSALVDVFDAGVTLVKSEISSVARKVGDMAKAKGVGVVLLLAAVGPLILALVFLILAVFYGLMRLGLGAWAAALVIALLSLGVTAALVFLGLKRLSAEVHTEEPLIRRTPMTDEKIVQPRTPATPDRQAQDTQAHAAATHAPASSPAAEAGRDPVHYAAGETRVVAERPGSATLRVEGGTTTVPVYEAGVDGQPQMYGSGLNEKLEEAGEVAGGGRVVQPRKVPGGLAVSTTPSYRQDMEKQNMEKGES